MLRMRTNETSTELFRVQVEYKNCSVAWREVKKRIVGDEEGFVSRLKEEWRPFRGEIKVKATITMQFPLKKRRMRQY